MIEYQNRREKYEYCSLKSDAMDNIKRRTGYLRNTTALVTCVLLMFAVNGMKKLIIIDHTKQNTDNFTTGENDTSPVPEDASSRGIRNKLGSLIYMSTLFSLWMLVFIIASFFHRICLLVEELCHRKTRYNGSYKKLFTAVFYGSWNKMYLYGSFSIIIAVCLFWDYNVILEAGCSNIYMLTMALPVSLFWLTLKGWSDTEFEHSASCAPCIGIAMAYGAYYNYYQHVLCELKERIVESEKTCGIDIPIKKLFLLFPSSGNCKSQLESENDIKYFNALPAIKKDKGGTLRRKMTNAMYEVSSNRAQPFFCVVEGVNCLSTLKEMTQSKEVFQEQAHLLYMTLKQVLDESPYKNSYVLLCYDDEHENETLSSRLQIKHEELLRKK